jgi:hypothetical protein
MPKKLTLAQVAKMARAKDPETWDRLSPQERLAWVDQLNEDAHREAQRRAAFTNVDRKMAEFLNIGKKKGRV